MKRHTSSVIGIVFITLSAALDVSASGTFIPGESGGDDYIMAKTVFYKKVVCDSCPFSGRSQSAEDALMLIQEFKSGSANNKLTDKEIQAAISFLQRRYKS